MPNMDGPMATKKIREMGYHGLILGMYICVHFKYMYMYINIYI
jgi:hypothetical protein